MKNMMIIGMVAIVLVVCVYLLTRVYQQCLIEYREDRNLSAIANMRDVPDTTKIAHDDIWN